MDVVTKVDDDGIKRAYLASGVFGLSAVNVNSTSALKVEGGSDFTFAGEHIAASGSVSVVTGKDAAGNAHLWVLDISDPVYPKLDGELDTTIPVFYDVALNNTGSMAVLAAGSQGIKVIDLSNPAAPSVIGSYDTPGSARGVALNSAGTLAYVADFYGLQLVSLANPRAPSLAGSVQWSTGGWIDVSVSGGIACVADQLGNALFVVDVSIPSAPQRVGYQSLNGTGAKIAIDKNNPAMVAVIKYTNYIGYCLEAFNISNPAQPVSKGYTSVTDIKGTVTGLDFIGGSAYVAAASEGLKVYQIASAPVFKYIVDAPGDAYDAAVNSTYTYATGFPAALSIIR